ncbi:MAG: hypothetical protein E4H01_06560 [Lysobacterales bacterium]|nr:MAG: hypothetical protein E4H01_06560 [Xanthomonadales bacterium]
MTTSTTTGRNIEKLLAAGSLLHGCVRIIFQKDFKPCALTAIRESISTVESVHIKRKTCSRCGAVKKVLGLGDRVFRCDQCGQAQDRDANASQNLCHAAKENLYHRLDGKSRLRRGKAGSDRGEAGTKPCSHLSTS